MKAKVIFGVLAMVCFALLTGCIAQTGTFHQNQKLSRMDTLQIKLKLEQNKDTDAWREQRQKIALATGDRVFDMDFPRVFDSLVLAVSSLELSVFNMERQSGYILAYGAPMPPTELNTMGAEAYKELARLNGYDSSLFDQENSVSTKGTRGLLVGTAMGITFQLVKMSAKQTKVKLRFADCPYPRAVEAYYKLIWQAVDKQIFVDKTIEGGVEKRH